MKLLVFLTFAGCAVKCDDAGGYYSVQQRYDPPTQELPFRIFWNVPTFQCKSKGVVFDNLYQKYGIIQNQNDTFQGDQVTILYDPGLFPAILEEESTGKLRLRNGGVPQEGKLDEHLTAFRYALDTSIPDPEFDGLGIIDFESWRPIFRQNSWGVLTPYRNLSLHIERRLHPWWSKSMVERQAKIRFERAAREFMQATLALARLLRPQARWGYYGFPYCFNMAGSNQAESCPSVIRKENDQISWLWSESAVLFPSVYSSKKLNQTQLAGLIRGRVTESARLGRGLPILPYFWFKYRDAGFMSEEDLRTALEAMYKSHTSGFIIWGSSNDVNTAMKCEKLKNYLENIFGPELKKYTKNTYMLDEERNDFTTEFFMLGDTQDEDDRVDSENEETGETSELRDTSIDDTALDASDTNEKYILIDIVLSLIENIQKKFDKQTKQETLFKIYSDRKKGTPIHDNFIQLDDNNAPTAKPRFKTQKIPMTRKPKKGKKGIPIHQDTFTKINDNHTTQTRRSKNLNKQPANDPNFDYTTRIPSKKEYRKGANDVASKKGAVKNNIDFTTTSYSKSVFFKKSVNYNKFDLTTKKPPKTVYKMGSKDNHLEFKTKTPSKNENETGRIDYRFNVPTKRPSKNEYKINANVNVYKKGLNNRKFDFSTNRPSVDVYRTDDKLAFTTKKKFSRKRTKLALNENNIDFTTEYPSKSLNKKGVHFAYLLPSTKSENLKNIAFTTEKNISSEYVLKRTILKTKVAPSRQRKKNKARYEITIPTEDSLATDHISVVPPRSKVRSKTISTTENSLGTTHTFMSTTPYTTGESLGTKHNFKFITASTNEDSFSTGYNFKSTTPSSRKRKYGRPFNMLDNDDKSTNITEDGLDEMFKDTIELTTSTTNTVPITQNTYTEDEPMVPLRDNALIYTYTTNNLDRRKSTAAPKMFKRSHDILFNSRKPEDAEVSEAVNDDDNSLENEVVI